MQFKEIVGQAAIKQRLINSVTENRVSHAQLFLGPEGSGSLALAVAYAQYFRARINSADDSCGDMFIMPKVPETDAPRSAFFVSVLCQT